MIKFKPFSWTPLKGKILLIGLAVIITVQIVAIIIDNKSTGKRLAILRSNEPILKFQMEIDQEPGTPRKKIVITDKLVLDSINKSISKAVVTSEPDWGDGILIRCTEFKESDSAEFNVGYNVSHGWSIDVGSKGIVSNYMIELVKPYVDTTRFSKLND
jgi:hypothetical protein